MCLQGHVSVRGYKSRAKKSNSDLPKDNLQSLYPEEVLYKSINAPDRFHERDAYWADRYLSPDQTLPDSDLLKGIHAYASDIYGRATSDGGKTDVRSLNETALLAFGILLEEAAGQMLGRTGDLALVEGEPIPSRARKPQNVRESRSRTRSPSQVPSSSGLDAVPSRKRRKLDA